MTPSPSGNHRLALVLLLTAPAFWAVNALVARAAPGHIEPNLLALLRWFIAGLLFALPARAELWTHRAHLRKQAGRYLLLGALSMWICGAWVYIAGRTTSAVNITLIYTASPVLIALMSVIWLRERLNARQGLGIVIALAGVTHVTIQGQWSALSSVVWVAGDAWIVACACAWALFSVLLRHWQSPLSVTARLAAVCGAGCLVIAPFAAYELWTAKSTAITSQGFGLAVLAALLPGYAAFFMNALLQRELGAARAALVLYLTPLYSAALAWALLGEQLHAFHAVGAFMVMGGLFLVSRR